MLKALIRCLENTREDTVGIYANIITVDRLIEDTAKDKREFIEIIPGVIVLAVRTPSGRLLPLLVALDMEDGVFELTTDSTFPKFIENVISARKAKSVE